MVRFRWTRAAGAAGYGTPLLDIKPYLPMSDRVMDAQYPDWLQGFPESMEEAAAFFSDPENAAFS